MKESNVEGLANRNGPELCGGGGNIAAEALAGEGAGVVWSPEIGTHVPSADRLFVLGRQHAGKRQGKSVSGSAGSETQGMHRDDLHGNRETPCLAWDGIRGPRDEPKGDTVTMYEHGESDRPIVPEKPRTTAAVRRRPRSEWRKGAWPRENGYTIHDSGLSAGLRVVCEQVMLSCSRSGSFLEEAANLLKRDERGRPEVGAV